MLPAPTLFVARQSGTPAFSTIWQTETDPLKILQLTDLHLVPPGHRRHGLDPAERLRTTLDHAIERHGDADLMVLTGDLADNGDLSAYAILAEALRVAPMPVQLLLGNHDHRANFLEVFPEAANQGAGFVQAVLDAPGGKGRLIFLDTNEPGWIGGRLCPTRLAWLDRALDEAAEVPVTVFMHHPPDSMRVPHFSRIGLHDSEPLLERLAEHPGGVRHVFCGHVHLETVANFDGISCSALRAVSHQMELSFETDMPWWIDTAPTYRVILLEPTTFVAYSVAAENSPRVGQAGRCEGP